MRKLDRYLIPLVLCTFLFACGKEDDVAPQLPPEDSMAFPDFKAGSATGGLTQALGDTSNVVLAATSVGFVTLVVNAALLTPRLMFAAAISETPTFKDGEWVWSHDFPLLGVRGELHGKKTTTVDLSMHVTGLRADSSYLNDFVWYSGSHSATSGTWEIFDPGTATAPGPTGAVVHIDWSRASATDKDLLFTNTRVGSAKNGDTLEYKLAGTIASMTIHDAVSGEGVNETGPAVDFSVVWNVESGSGKMSRNADHYCWDTLANGQVNITCPTGDWPTP